MMRVLLHSHQRHVIVIFISMKCWSDHMGFGPTPLVFGFTEYVLYLNFGFGSRSLLQSVPKWDNPIWSLLVII